MFNIYSTSNDCPVIGNKYLNTKLTKVKSTLIMVHQNWFQVLKTFPFCIKCQLHFSKGANFV